MKTRTLSLTALAATACIPHTGDTGDSAAPEADADADADTPPAPNPYSRYAGREVFEHAYAMEAPGALSCRLVWEVTGTPLAIPGSCRGCEFVFDVALAYDEAASSDDGTCGGLAGDFGLVYAYAPDYGDSGGGYALSGYYGAYYAFAPASFSGGRFVYASGFRDRRYEGEGGEQPELVGLYFTEHYAGEVTVE